MRTLLFIAALAAAGPALAADVKPVGPAKPANAAVTQSSSNVKPPPSAAAAACGAFDAKACIASGGTVTVNADKSQSCVYADSRKGRGICIGRAGGAY